MKITNKMEGAALHKRRFSYLNKLIADEDIPLEVRSSILLGLWKPTCL